MSDGGHARQAFPWDEVMTIGLGVLRLSPEAFWSMTPLEFAAAARGLGPRRSMPIGRDEFDRLMRLFPDPIDERKPNG